MDVSLGRRSGRWNFFLGGLKWHVYMKVNASIPTKPLTIFLIIYYYEAYESADISQKGGGGGRGVDYLDDGIDCLTLSEMIPKKKNKEKMPGLTYHNYRTDDGCVLYKSFREKGATGIFGVYP